MCTLAIKLSIFFPRKSGVKISVKWQGTDPDPPTRVVRQGRLDSDTRNTVLVMTTKVLNINIVLSEFFTHLDIRNGRGRWLIYRYNSCLSPSHSTSLVAARAGIITRVIKRPPPPSCPLGQARGKAKPISIIWLVAPFRPPISGMLNLLSPFLSWLYLYSISMTCTWAWACSSSCPAPSRGCRRPSCWRPCWASCPAACWSVSRTSRSRY